MLKRTRQGGEYGDLFVYFIGRNLTKVTPIAGKGKVGAW